MGRKVEREVGGSGRESRDMNMVRWIDALKFVGAVFVVLLIFAAAFWLVIAALDWCLG